MNTEQKTDPILTAAQTLYGMVRRSYGTNLPDQQRVSIICGDEVVTRDWTMDDIMVLIKSPGRARLLVLDVFGDILYVVDEAGNFNR